MNKLYIEKLSKSYSTDAFNNPQYAYFIRYQGPDSHGYMTIMTEEGYMRLQEVLKQSHEIIYSEE